MVRAAVCEIVYVLAVKAMGYRILWRAEVQGHILREDVGGFIVPTFGSASPDVNGTRFAAHLLDNAETDMLKEMGPKMKAGPHGCFITRAHERAAQYHGMLSIEAGCTKVIIKGMNSEAFKGMEIVFTPVPYIPAQI